MANRTVKAGAGNFSATGTWVEGIVPTSADDVITNGSSTGTLTIDVASACRSFTIANGVAVTHTSTLAIGDASGGALNYTGAGTISGAGVISFVSTSNNGGTGWGITTATKTLPGVTFNGTGGKWVNQDAFSCGTQTITHTRGTWDTGNFGITAGLYSSNNSNTRTLTLGSSAIALSQGANGGHPILVGSTGLTITANTATVTISATGGDINCQNNTDFNGMSVTFTGNQNTNGGFAPAAGVNMTFKNWTYTGTAVATNVFAISTGGGTVTFTGNIVINGNSRTNQVLVSTNTIGTNNTITCNGTVTLTNCDFQDITGAGSASWNFSGQTDIGDAGGNSGITFPTGITCFWKSASGTFSGANWFTTSGGSTSARRPLCQDTVRFDANSIVTTATIAIDVQRCCKDLDCTSASFTSGTLQNSAVGSGLQMYGSLTLKSGMSALAGGASTWNLAGRGTHTITTAGVTLGNAATWSLAINQPSGTYTMQDALTCTGPIAVDRTTFNTGNFNISALTFTNSVAATITLGTSTVTLIATAAGSFWIMLAGSTFSGASSTIVLSVASANTRTFAGGGKTYGTLTYTVAGSTGQLTTTGTNTYTTINFSDASSARTLVIPISVTTTVTNLNVTGTSGALMSINSSSAGTAATLATAAGCTVIYGSIKDITATPSNACYALDSTNVSGNTGWWFYPPNRIPLQNKIKQNDRNAIIRTAVF